MKLKAKRPLQNTVNNKGIKDDRGVIIEVLEPPTKVNYNGEKFDGITVYTDSTDISCFTEDTIWVGCIKTDKTFGNVFRTNTDADNFIENLKRAVAQYNGREVAIESDEEIIE